MKTIRMLHKSPSRRHWVEVDPILVDMYDSKYQGCFHKMVEHQAEAAGVLGKYLVIVHEPEKGRPMKAYEYSAERASPPIVVTYQ